MFVKALKIAEKYTHPVVLSKRFENGKVECGCATFIILNQEGWILTSAHVFDEWNLFTEHKNEREAYEKQVKAIEANVKLTAKQIRNQIGKLRKNHNWISHYSFLWAGTNATVNNIIYDRLADIAVGKLEPFDKSIIDVYPTFGDPNTELPQGTSLCRLGFPFHAINATFDAAADSFSLADDVFPMPRFPNDGILTRHIKILDETTKREVSFIETSTPGLRGQSGGPVFDVTGKIWGCLLYTSPSPRDGLLSRMPSSA